MAAALIQRAQQSQGPGASDETGTRSGWATLGGGTWLDGVRESETLGRRPGALCLNTSTPKFLQCLPQMAAGLAQVVGRIFLGDERARGDAGFLDGIDQPAAKCSLTRGNSGGGLREARPRIAREREVGAGPAPSLAWCGVRGRGRGRGRGGDRRRRRELRARGSEGECECEGNGRLGLAVVT